MRYSRFIFVLMAVSPFCAAQQAQITTGVASRPQTRPAQRQVPPGTYPRQNAAHPQPQAQPAPSPTPSPAPTPVSLQPMRPSDMPPVPPQVTFHNGMLTVQAINSTMSSLLQAIRGKTGIQFEGGENSPDRVAISVGPAPEGEVLSSIFTGSNFDYVVIGRQDSPGIVQRVILTPRRGGPGAVMANGQPPAPQPQAAEQAADDQTNADDQANADPDQPQDVPEEPPQVQPTPEPDTQQQSNPKTPEQLLQELKEMQQQQQQQQPQQGNETQNPGQVPRKPPQ